MKKSRKARHHTTPQRFLKYFSFTRGQKNFLWCYDKQNPSDPVEISLKDASVQKHFYSIKQKSGEWETTPEDLLENIENQLLPVINDLQESGRIKQSQIPELSESLVHLFLRSPTAIENFKALKEAAIRRRWYDLQNSQKKQSNLYENRFQIPGFEETKNLNFEDFKSLILDLDIKDFKPIISNIRALSESYDYQRDIYYDYLLKMRWGIVKSSPTDEFITSDTPAVFFVKTNQGYILGGGLGLSGAGVVMPLSPSLCLLACRDKNAFETIMHNKTPLSEINKVMCMGSQRFIYAQSNSATLRSMTKIASKNNNTSNIDIELLARKIQKK